MEERKEEGEAEIQEHGPEHWFSKWERQCLAEAEQDEQLSPELQEEAAAAAQPEHKQQKLWHLFQNSATAVAQLYKGEAAPPSWRRPGLRSCLSARFPARFPGPGRSPHPAGIAGRLGGDGPRRGPLPSDPHDADGGAALGGGTTMKDGETPDLEYLPRIPTYRSGCPRPDRGGRGGVPVTKWRRRRWGVPIVPRAGLGAETARGASLSLPGGVHSSGRAVVRFPFFDPITPVSPSLWDPQTLNKMAKPNMAVPE